MGCTSGKSNDGEAKKDTGFINKSSSISRKQIDYTAT